MSTDTTANVADGGAPAPTGRIAVTTHHNDNGRTGANLQETMLTTANVNPQKFGKLFERQVDGQIYAQILYVSQVNIPNVGVRNVAYVATMHNSVYAYDADDPAATEPLWKREVMHPPVSLPDGRIGPGDDYHDIALEVGILSTPVISLEQNALYCVAATCFGSPAPDAEKHQPDTPDSIQNYAHFLHALDLETGEDVLDPVQLAASVPGTGYVGDDNRGDIIVDGQVTFISNRQIQRAALLLSNNTIYIAFAAYEDTDPYHGWILAYDTQTLEQVAVFNTTANGKQGGIWQAGQGPAADNDGNIYVMTGNGSPTQPTPTPNGSLLGDCVVKLNPELRVLDWFLPYNFPDLYNADNDVGSSGPMLIPGTNLLIGGGKEGKFFLFDKNKMGHFVSTTNNNAQILQWFYVIPPENLNDPYTMAFQKTHHIHGGPIFWTGPMGAWLYIWAEDDVLKAFQFKNNRFFTTSMPPKPAPPNRGKSFPGGFLGTTASKAANVPVQDWIAMPGGAISLSANGGKAGTGIVWASHPHGLNPDPNVHIDANQHVVKGIMRAYNAENLTQELWNSETNARDSIGNFAKFNPPTVANGKVYLASFGNVPIPSGGDVLILQPQDIQKIQASYHFSVYGLR
ncbi:MAG TPA: hypothetical protein VGT82_15600 [Ktedonobacteraceae bacterium]|nr:hypothetical protein [Ktedonobacteraceae bacterium]